MLYDLAGKPLLESTVKGLGIDDSRDFGGLVDVTDKFTLIAVFERERYGGRLFSIAVYDNKTQKITQWLARKVSDFRVKYYDWDTKKLSVTFNEESGYQQKTLFFNGSKFILEDTAENTRESIDRMEGSMGIDMPPVSEEKYIPQQEAGRSETHRSEVRYYRLFKDSLFYHRNMNTSLVNLPAGAKLIFQTKYSSSSQTAPVIFQHNNKFGLVINGSAGNALYDSVVYFGNHFIAGRPSGGSVKYGLLDGSGNEVIPFIYDSITGHIPVFKFESDGDGPDRGKYIFRLHNKEDVEYFSNKGPYNRYPSKYILVYQNGKAGLVDEKNKIILPVRYDLIAENVHHLSFPYRSTLILLKKGNRYGLVPVDSERWSHTIEFDKMIEPIFTDMPVYYINDYLAGKVCGYMACTTASLILRATLMRRERDTIKIDLFYNLSDQIRSGVLDSSDTS